MLDLKSLIPWGEARRTPTRRDAELDPFTAFRREMDRVFDDIFRDSSRALWPRGADWTGPMPQLDVSETDKEVVVSAELPGLDEKDFEVTLSGDVLTIRGEKKDEHEEKDGGRHYVERRYGSFSRSVRLPYEAGDQDVSANFDKGVLTVRIPKPDGAQSKVKRIDIKAG